METGPSGIQGKKQLHFYCVSKRVIIIRPVTKSHSQYWHQDAESSKKMNNSAFFNQSGRSSRPASKQNTTNPHSFASQVPHKYTEADFVHFSDYYAVLECEPSAERDVVKKNYRRLILDWHPDKRPESPTKEGSKMFQLINDAWDVLKSTEKRTEYTKLWREYKRFKLAPYEKAELSRKEGNEMYKKGQIAPGVGRCCNNTYAPAWIHRSIFQAVVSFCHFEFLEAAV